MSTATDPQPISTRRVDPDPAITSAIGRHHSLETAVADLVDNSLDAGAQHILIRFLMRDEIVSGLVVVDDGQGMDSVRIDEAMTYARRRDYGDGELGHFGIGMKAASLSQADRLHVWSRRHAAPAVGRGLAAESLDTGPMVETFAADEAQRHLDSLDAGFPLDHGTMVEWREPREFLHSRSPEEQQAWAERQIASLRTHLGAVLHRILEHGDVTITLDTFDEDVGLGGVPRRVEPLDPFPPRTGLGGYPAELDLGLSDGEATALLTVWPVGAVEPGWALGGRPHTETQGLFVYRHDRLLQMGGWGGLTEASPDLERARVRLDITDILTSHVTINPEKTGVVLGHELVSALMSGTTADGATLRDYLEDVRTGARDARKRTPRPIEVPEPGKGFSAALVQAFEANARFSGHHPVDMRWTRLGANVVFEVVPEKRTIFLNTTYREALGGIRSGRSDDAPLIKTLLHVLIGKYAAGAFLGAKAKREIAAWNQVLLSAIDVHGRQGEIRRGR